MRKKRKDIRQAGDSPLMAYCIALLFFICFLVLLWALVVITRALVG